MTLVNLQKEIESTICSEIPNAFWERKKHVVDLPYEKDFNEKEIPTKARPIQMNPEMEQICRHLNKRFRKQRLNKKK